MIYCHACLSCLASPGLSRSITAAIGATVSCSHLGQFSRPLDPAVSPNASKVEYAWTLHFGDPIDYGFLDLAR